jgi:hypothetical protein
MRLNIGKQSQAELEADLAVFEEMFAAKSAFFDAVVDGCCDGGSVKPAELRQETVYAIAHFFYLLKVFGVDGPDGLRNFAIAHNQNMAELREDGAERTRLGIQPQRLEGAMFNTDDNLERLKVNCGSRGVRLSQSDLARFLVEFMSAETCRTAVAVLHKAGYLKRSKSALGAVLISSTGTLEELFAGYIRTLRLALNRQSGIASAPLRVVE